MGAEDHTDGKLGPLPAPRARNARSGQKPSLLKRLAALQVSGRLWGWQLRMPESLDEAQVS